MKTAISSHLAKILCLVLWFIAPGVQAANESISSLPSTSSASAGDDIILNTTNSGAGTYTTKRVSIANLVKSAAVTNGYPQTNGFLPATNGTAANLSGSTSNLNLNVSTLSATNLVTLAGTIAGTAGNTYLTYTGADFSKIGLFDQIYPNPNPNSEQWLVVGITNSGQKIAIYGTLAFTHSGDGLQQTPVSMAQNDTVPRRVAGVTGGVWGTASFSIGNNGGISAGYYFGDGINSASINNLSGTPDYFVISVAPGLGANNGNQFQIQDGSQYFDLVIFADDSVGFRGNLTNSFGNALNVSSPLTTAQGITSGEQILVNTTNEQSSTVTVGNAGNTSKWTAATGTFPTYLGVGWTMKTINDGGSYTIIQVVDTTHIVTLNYPVTSYTAQSVAFDPPAIQTQDRVPRVVSFTASPGDTGGKRLVAFNINTPTNSFWLTAENNGELDITGAGTGNASFKMFSQCTYDALRLENSGAVSVKVGLTNSIFGSISMLSPVQFNQPTNTPVNTNHAVAWMVVTNNGTQYYSPLFQ